MNRFNARARRALLLVLPLGLMLPTMTLWSVPAHAEAPEPEPTAVPVTLTVALPAGGTTGWKSPATATVRLSESSAHAWPDLNLCAEGTVTLMAGAQAVPTSAPPCTSPGVFTFALGDLPVGTHSMVPGWAPKPQSAVTFSPADQTAATASLSVTPATPSLTLVATPDTVPWNSPVSLTATLAPSVGTAVPLGTVQFEASRSSGDWITLGDPVTAAESMVTSILLEKAGDWQVRARFVAAVGANHTDATSTPVPVTVQLADPALSLTPPTAEAPFGSTVTWSSSGLGNGDTAWLSTTPSVCSVGSPPNGTTQPITYLSRAGGSARTAQTCTVQIDRSADPDHTTGDSITASVTVVGREPLLVVTTDGPATVGEPVLLKFRATGVGGMGLAGKATVTIDGVARLTDETWALGARAISYVPPAAGNHLVKITFTPDNYDYDVAQKTQSVTSTIGPWMFTPPRPTGAESRVGLSWQPPTGVPGSEEAGLILSAGNQPACEVSAGKVHFTAAGVCLLTFSKPADATHLATTKTVPLDVTLQPATLRLIPPVPPAVVNQTSTFTVEARDANDQLITAAGGTVEVCPAGQTPCPTDSPRGLLIDGTTTLTLRPESATPLVARLVPGNGWPAAFAVPEPSNEVPVLRGNTTITNSEAIPTDLQSDDTWERTFRSDSTGSFTTQTSGACSVVSSVPGATSISVRLHAQVSGACTLDVRQSATGDWNAPEEYSEDFSIALRDSKLLVSLPENPLVDRDLSDQAVDDPGSPTDPMVATISGLDWNSTPTEGDWRITLETPTQDVLTLVDERTTLEARRIRLPLKSEGAYRLTVDFRPVNLGLASRTRSFSLTATRRTQTIALSAPPSGLTVGTSWTPVITQTPDLVNGEEPGGPEDRGYLISIGSASQQVCAVVGSAVEFRAAGLCTVRVTTPRTRAFLPAADELSLIQIERNTVDLVVTPPAQATVGEPTTVRVTSARSGGQEAVPGTVTLSVEGTEVVRDVVDDTTPGRFTVPWTPTDAGELKLTARFTPTDAVTFQGGPSTPTPVTVNKATTTTSVRIVGTTAVATVVSSTVPRSGTVTFTTRSSTGTELFVDDVDVVDGVATWPRHGLPDNMAGTVQASYAGSTNRTGSDSPPVARELPVVTASVVPTGPISNGWYRAPVRIGFACTPTTGSLLHACPADVTLTGDGARRTATAVVETVDGARVTVTSAPVSIDRTRPRVAISGPRAGAWYRGDNPSARCVGTDSTSGILRCRVQTVAVDDRLRRVTATATDRAGNVASTSLTYRVFSEWVNGVPALGTTFQVRRGRSIKVTARTNGVQPQLMMPTRPGRNPTVSGPGMGAVSIENGITTWTTTYKVPTSARKGAVLRLGIKTRNAPLRIVRIKVT